MLRTRFLHQVELNLVSDARYKPEDFKIRHQEDPRDSGRAILRIEYAFNAEYFLSARIKSGSYEVECCPGVVSLRESESYENQQNFFRAVTQWTTRIREELISIPLQREVA